MFKNRFAQQMTPMKRVQEFVCYSSDGRIKLRLMVKPAKVLDLSSKTSDIYAYRLNGNGYNLIAKRLCSGRKGIKPEIALRHFKEILENQ
jgi:hypothetical protein